MRHVKALLVVLMLLTVSLAAARGPGENAERGLRQACHNGNDRPCELLGLIPETTVSAGETRTYEDDEYTAEGTITVKSGGTVVVDNATITFERTSDGFVVEPRGTLIIRESVLQEASGGSEYGLDIAPLATFVLNRTTVTGGSGVALASNDAEVSENLLEEIPVALRLTNVSVDVHHNHFRNNSVAVNQTYGSPTLQLNFFEGGDFCVRDWRTNPTVASNTFRGCHIGIWHEQSESELLGNDMEDQSTPPGGGIVVMDTQSPIIEGNRISHYGVGILVVNARAFIRNNTIHDNVGDGIRIENNSAPMDIQGNVIRDNGGNGIRLVNVLEVPVFNNEIRDNGARGILVEGAPEQLVTGNVVRGGFPNAIEIVSSPAAVVADNDITATPGCTCNNDTKRGIYVLGDSPFSVLSNNTVVGGDHGISSRATGAEIFSNVISGATLSGMWIGGNGSSLSEDLVHTSHYGVTVLGAHDVSVTNLTVTNNVEDGLVLAGVGATSVVGLHATGNGGDGVFAGDSFFGPLQSFSIQGSYIANNGANGAYVVSAPSGALTGNILENNALVGVRIRESSNLTIDHNTIIGGSVSGLGIENSSALWVVDNALWGVNGDGIRVTDSAWIDLELNDVQAANGTGIAIVDSTLVSIEDSTVRASGDRGVLIADSSNVHLFDVASTGNAIGVAVLRGGDHLLYDVNASANAGAGFLVTQVTSTVNLTGARAFDNEWGLYADVQGNWTIADGAWWQGNVVAGVENAEQMSIVFSRHSYWGSPNGPTHPDNPGGDGDAVIGNVDYIPYLTAPPS